MREQPLSDVTVVELGNIVAGPFASQILADMGADVVKIERPGTGDIIRASGQTGDAMFSALNRNKRSVALDLKADAGMEAFDELVAEADVFIENMGRGAAERLGIGYEDLRETNPGLVYLSIKGFQEGPYGDRPGMDVVAEAMSGLMSVTGEKGRQPVRVGTSIADMGGAMYGVMGVMLALRERDRTGEGQRIDGTLFEASTHWMGYWLTYAELLGEDPEPLGASHPSWGLYDVFPTEGGWLFVGVTTERHWPAFCRAADMEELLADERFDTGEKRRERKEELTELVREKVADEDREELLEKLLEENVPAAPVNKPSEILDDEHLEETGLLAHFTAESEGEEYDLQTPLTPIVGSEMGPEQRTDPPAIGEHNAEVFADLGLDAAEIERLREDGAFGGE
jgi:crotonobetainyl-CoA:carnitine CoA-transferase CaiB-like acyl-CoA transferase